MLCHQVRKSVLAKNFVRFLSLFLQGWKMQAIFFSCQILSNAGKAFKILNLNLLNFLNSCQYNG